MRERKTKRCSRFDKIRIFFLKISRDRTAVKIEDPNFDLENHNLIYLLIMTFINFATDFFYEVIELSTMNINVAKEYNKTWE